MTGIFKHLDPNTNISDISDAIKSLKIVEAFEEDIFNEDANTVPNMNDRTMKYIWKFLLTPVGVSITPGVDEFNNPITYGNDPNKAHYESYTIGSSMGVLVTNFETHVRDEDLNTLFAAGLINVSDSFLDKDIRPDVILLFDGTGEGQINFNGRTKYGQLKLSELMMIINYLG